MNAPSSDLADQVLPDAAWVVALAGLSGMGPVRLSALLATWPAAEAWDRVAHGAVLDALASRARGVDAGLVQRWAGEAARTGPAERWAALEANDVSVLVASDPAYPSSLREDCEPPAVLFHRGALAALDRPLVAIIGTRACTTTGRGIARELGEDLSAAGVGVVSGLALGIDGAAHAGALAAAGAAPVGVVGTGLDVVYPRRHRDLWSAVGGRGLLLSEYPPGTTPEPWRFPARNRIIAALAPVVVVVESHARGGSMHTVESALERDRTVMAVPGSIRSPASTGTNALLAAGCPPARDVDDVLVALGLRGFDPDPRSRAGTSAGVAQVEAALEPDARAVLDALGTDPATLDQLAERSGFGLGSVAVLLTALERDSWVVRRGSWYERGGDRR